MLFKNLQVYLITEPNAVPAPKGLDEKLQELKHREPGSHEPQTFGFIAPAAVRPDYMVKLVTTDNVPILLLAAKRTEKIIPSAAVNELLVKKVAEVEEKEVRKVPKKERQRMKDEIIFSLLPNALTKSTTTYAYIDLNVTPNMLVVNEASAKRADDFVSLLRKALGSLPAVPLYSLSEPAPVMTGWLTHPTTRPYRLTLERTATLESVSDNGKVTVRDVDPESDEVATHIDNGKVVTRIGLTYNDEVAFELNRDLQFKKIKLLDAATNRIIAKEPWCEDEVISADILIQADTFRRAIDETIKAFGGLPIAESADASDDEQLA